jgi:hypothetical protein
MLMSLHGPPEPHVHSRLETDGGQNLSQIISKQTTRMKISRHRGIDAQDFPISLKRRALWCVYHCCIRAVQASISHNLFFHEEVMRKLLSYLSMIMLVVAVALLWTPMAEAGKPGGGRMGGMRGGPARGGALRPGFAAYGAGGLNFGGIGTVGYNLGGNLGYGFGGFAASSPYSLGQVPVPPYFALHPPVYYSAPVARPYGYSPYAYPGWIRTPEVAVEPPCPQVMENPYVEPTSSTSVDSAKAATATDDDFALAEPQSQQIINPYVDHPSAFPPAFDMEVATAK